MKSILLSIVFCILVFSSVSAQDHPETIIYKINQLKTDKDLLYYLRINELIDTAKYHRCAEDLCISKSGLQTGITYVNLFGDSTKEVVLHIKYFEVLYYFHFYYQEQGSWVKVPDYIFETGAIAAQITKNDVLNIRYEEIMMKGESIVFIHSFHHDSDELNIYGIHEDGIENLYSRNLLYYQSDGNGNSYAGELEVEIVEKTTPVFPKKIRIRGKETMYKEAFMEEDKMNVYSEKTIDEVVNIYKGK